MIHRIIWTYYSSDIVFVNMRRKLLAPVEQTRQVMLSRESRIRLHRMGNNEERNMESKLVWDLLPEEFLQEDKGCDLPPSCLDCPFLIA